MVEGYVDLEYFELPILIWNLMLAVCIVCKYEANFRELQRMSGIAQCSSQFVAGAGRGIILLAVNAFVIFSVTRKGPEELSLPGTLIATHWNHWHCSPMGPLLGTQVPMGTFLGIWVPIGSPFYVLGPLFPLF